MSDLTQIRQWEEIPFFPNPKEEANYWATHQLDPALLAASLSRTESQESTSITLRMDPRMLSRLKRLAARRYLNYQSMIKQWLAEHSRFLCLGKSLSGKSLFSLYSSDGRRMRPIASRTMTHHETYFYDRKAKESL